jgi:hypothetical protein
MTRRSDRVRERPVDTIRNASRLGKRADGLFGIPRTAIGIAVNFEIHTTAVQGEQHGRVHRPTACADGHAFEDVCDVIGMHAHAAVRGHLENAGGNVRSVEADPWK